MAAAQVSTQNGGLGICDPVLHYPAACLASCHSAERLSDNLWASCSDNLDPDVVAAGPRFQTSTHTDAAWHVVGPVQDQTFLFSVCDAHTLDPLNASVSLGLHQGPSLAHLRPELGFFSDSRTTLSPRISSRTRIAPSQGPKISLKNTSFAFTPTTLWLFNKKHPTRSTHRHAQAPPPRYNCTTRNGTRPHTLTPKTLHTQR